MGTFYTCIRSSSLSPGRSVTRARRLYVSRLANFRESDRPQKRGSEQGCELPPLRQGRRIWREPRSTETRAYKVSLLCVVSTERCVTQVPEFDYDDRKGVGACDRRSARLGFLFPVPSPGRSVTQARRLYVSSLANFR